MSSNTRFSSFPAQTTNTNSASPNVLRILSGQSLSNRIDVFGFRPIRLRIPPQVIAGLSIIFFISDDGTNFYEVFKESTFAPVSADYTLASIATLGAEICIPSTYDLTCRYMKIQTTGALFAAAVQANNVDFFLQCITDFQ